VSLSVPAPLVRLARPAVAVPILCLVAMLAALPGVIRGEATLDEAYVYALSQHGFVAMLAFWTQDPQALLSQIIAYPFAVTGHSVWWLRIPPLLAFGGSVALLWWTASQRYSPRVALGATALLAISPLAVLNAPDARWPMYALLAGTASWGCLLKAIDTGDRRWWIAYSLVALACIYTNATLVLLALAHAVPVLWERRRALRPWLISLAGVAVATIPLALLTIGASGVNPLFRVPKPGPADVPGFLAQLLGGGGPQRLRQLLVLLAVVLVLAAAWGLRSRLGSPEARGGWLALTWLVVPIAGAFLISQGQNSIWLTRYLIATVPAGCLLIAWAASRVPPKAAIPLVSAIVVLMAAAVIDESRSRGEPIEEWTAAIVAARPPGAPVVFYEAEGAQGAGYNDPSLGAADGTPMIPGWDETPPPPDITLLDSPEFDRLPVGPPGAELVQRLARRSASGVVVLALRPSSPEAPGITWARENCTVTSQDFTDSPTTVYRVSDCRTDTSAIPARPGV
jgi:hypothetical protein